MPTVRVPQREGEVRVSVAGDPPRVFPVVDGAVQVEDPGDAALLVHVIDGAVVVAAAEPAPADSPGAPAVLVGMKAADLIALVEAHPERAGEVLAAERARPEGERATVIAAAERAAADPGA